MAICDSKLYFSRDVKVFIEPLTEAGATQSQIWEVPVLDGFSFSQSNNSSEVTLAEMESASGVSRRGKKMFNDSLAPAEWSFSTYARPFKSGGLGRGATKYDADTLANIHAVEEVLFALMAGKALISGHGWKGKNATSAILTVVTTPISGGAIANQTLTVTNGGTGYENGIGLTYIVPGGDNNCVVTYTASGGIITAAAVTTPGTGYTELNGVTTLPGIGYEYFDLGLTKTSINFRQSNTSALGMAHIYFVFPELTYKVKNASVNEATINFDIDGIAQIEWSGMGVDILEHGSAVVATVNEGVLTTDNFIRNRLTQMTAAPNKTGVNSAEYAGLENSYDLTLTGGSITISNNITFITPEELGKVNIPLGHVTGTRSISGSFTNYLVSDAVPNKSVDFWGDLKGLTTVVTHDFALNFYVGGSTGVPRIEFKMNSCHIEIPTHSVEDVISIETNFTALGSCINAADELIISYAATAVPADGF